MTRLDAASIGRRIAEARARANLTQHDLASEVSLDRSGVAKIESGLRKVSALELSAISRVLGQRLEWFLAEPTPAIMSHRSHEGLDTEDSQLDVELEKLSRDVGLVLSLDHDWELATCETQPRPSNHAEAEELALRARVLMAVDPGEPLRDLVAAAAKIGLLAFSHNFGPDTADAATVLLEVGAISIINSANKVGRRRLSLAHEIAHCLVADEYTVDWSAGTSQNGLEGIFDRFARALLAPAAACTAFWNSTRQSYDLRTSALITASHYRVDMATLARRLTELELVDANDARAIREVRTTKADIVEHNLFVPSDLRDTSLPADYAKSVLRLYRHERISSERCLDLLQGTYDLEDLPELPERQESEIWKFVS